MSHKKPKSILIRPYLYKKATNLISQKTLFGLLDSILAPIYEIKEEINIIYRISDRQINEKIFQKHLKRSEFLRISHHNLEEIDCKDTQFLIISTKQYSASILFDFSLSDKKNKAIYSIYINAKETNELLKILLPEQTFFIEKRINIELNEAIHNIVKFCENTIEESNINEIEKTELEKLTQDLKRDEYFAKQSRYISHEIKNHLSIIDIYTKIIEKKAENTENINKATTQIFKSIKNITKLLNELKTFSEAEINIYSLSEIIDEVICSINEPAKSNNIKINTNIKEDLNIAIDKDKFQNVIINIIKNGIEAFNNTNIENRLIEIYTETKDNKIFLLIRNNGKEIEKENLENIFKEGFTTKETGTGLGLYICKQNLKEQFCDLVLKKSTKEETIFEISINKI